MALLGSSRKMCCKTQRGKPGIDEIQPGERLRGRKVVSGRFKIKPASSEGGGGRVGTGALWVVRWGG